jgi:RNA polymerase sigma-70 factor (ECF subfamily)
MDDAALLQRARRGDDAAFSELFERHQRAIYRYAVYMCGPEGGDDIVQETFMAVLKQSVRHDLPAAGVRAYLLGIARHRVLKWNRVDAWPAPAEPFDEVREVAGLDSPSALEQLAHAEEIETVRAAVRSLPPAYREVLLLCELQEMDYAAAAQVLQCPIGTVRSRMNRAKSLLATKLSRDAQLPRRSRV